MHQGAPQRRSRGFTLLEMLVVVAIIAALVAIAVPVMSGQMKRAQIETDNANMRAAKAAAMIDFATGDLPPEPITISEKFTLGRSKYKDISSQWYIWYFDAGTGTVVPDSNKPSKVTGKYLNYNRKTLDLDHRPYGQMDAMKFKSLGSTRSHKGQFVAIAISKDGETVLMGWTQSGINYLYIDWYEDFFDADDLA